MLGYPDRENMIVNLSGDNPMNDRYLQAKSQVTEAVRASLTVKAAMLGVPLAIACNAFIPPAAAQDEAAPDQVSRNTDDSSDEALEEIIVRGKVTLRHREAFQCYQDEHGPERYCAVSHRCYTRSH